MEAKIAIDDNLLQDALSVSGLQTKEELINEALREYIKVKKRKDLTELAGRIEFYQDFNHKKMRELNK
ncbi:type II toxin-antitoxin system VapB family antitoxin [Desulfonatronovibrio magnus]|uniref:type II toxin-antitoxin system VapB family antitoxin n=1 Tax=Desulfonatronovibrio magnus TaxID=698827 RepID=UPI0005EB65C4|nr:type II toxin-antitoxin system VapB family antitoxin [Desulfonatronovibrio magnus]